MERPVLRIVRGSPTDEEVAALLAVVATRGSGHDVARAPRSAWNDPRRLVREPVFPGPGGWVAAARPR